MKRLVGLLWLAALTLGVSSGGALAATECNGPLSGTVVGGVVVNDGDFCVLDEASVSGGVEVNPGGILILCGSTINGGLDANGAGNVIVGAEEIDCAGNVINGGVHITNTGPGALAGAPSIALERSVIHGGVHLAGNQGPMAVATNVIAGGLFCRGNAFDLDDEGSPSTVTGKVTCKLAD